MIEIKHRWSGKVLYTAENAQDVRAAVLEAVKQGAYLQGADLRGAYLQGAYLRGADLRGADLQGAYLRGADLRGADLRGAYLRGADLQGAYLRGADLQGAYLRGADLRGADLRGAYLRGADLRGADLRGAYLRGDVNSPRHPLHAIRADMWSILDQAPGEAEALRAAMAEGRINGSVYSDGECGCLCGTIGIAHAGSADESAVSAALAELGIQKEGSRLAEQWFIDIVKGDKPLPLDTKEWPSESLFRLSHAHAWAKEWLVSRKAIAAALAESEPAK
jgi:hypothetical protein